MKEKILIVEDQFVEANYLEQLLTEAGYEVMGICRSVLTAQEVIRKEKPGFVLLDIFLKGKLTGIDLAKELSSENIPFVYLSANATEDVLNEAKATQPYGFLVKPFREKDLLVTLEIARYRHEYSLQARFSREEKVIRQLENIVSDPGDRGQALLKAVSQLQQIIPFDFFTAGPDDEKDIPLPAMCYLRIGYDEYQEIGIKELSTISGQPSAALVGTAWDQPKEANGVYYNGEAFESFYKHSTLGRLFAKTFSLRSLIEMPLNVQGSGAFYLRLYSKNPNGYNSEHLGLLKRLQFYLVHVLERLTGNEKAMEKSISASNDAAVRKAPPVPAGFEGIIGKSHLLLNVFDQISQVARADTSVLLLGESGTGKEKIADCIHKLSNRNGKPFIKMNCGALPATLIESELFGHEKGSFTGASERRIGKFEKADKGTIFLDEIGEMPIELQVKLLRVLQEKEIERVGGGEPFKIDARVIAATNKNLEKEVAEGRFRLDLYYRLNVFPVTIPPLRERKEDIEILASHFVQVYGNKAGKKINGFTENVLHKLRHYDWPGNVRELENVIERHVLLSKKNMIEDISLPGAADQGGNPERNKVKTIDEQERDYIISILKKSHGRIWGAGGAAEILNIPPTTLRSKMKKLGIKKEYIQ